MGNCQAAEVAAVVIQHPGGKVERLYWPATAADVMRSNPGHYVALVLLRVSSSGGGGGGKVDHSAAGAAAVGDESGGAEAAKITKIKLLKPKETLLLGQVYRLVTSQEVTKALQARRQEKMRRCKEVTDHHRHHHRQPQSGDSAISAGEEQRRPSDHQERKPSEKDRHRSTAAGGGGGGSRGRNWRPSLQSISESAS